MMNIIKFKENAPIRVQVIKGEPWFVAKDVCDLLGLVKGRNSVALLDADEKADAQIVGVRSKNGVEQAREMTIVNESGLYHLVFQSQKPEAKAFRKWVTSEVLPAIRKYGRYAAPGSKEQLKLEASNARRERKKYLDEIESHLKWIDKKAIAKKFHIQVWDVNDVLEGRRTDVNIEAECIIRAQRNHALRKLLDTSKFKKDVMKLFNK